jgi:hypothetical protein
VFRDTKEASAAMMAEYERMYRDMTSDGELDKLVKKQQDIIDFANIKKSKLLQLVAGGNIADTDFKEMTSQCNDEIKAAEEELADLQNRQKTSEEFRTHMENVRKVLRDAERNCASGVITKDFIDTFIDKIFVTPEPDGTMRLDVRVFTGNSTAKYLEKLKRRIGIMTGVCERTEENPVIATGTDGAVSTGHTFKKMIESYEKSL